MSCVPVAGAVSAATRSMANTAPSEPIKKQTARIFIRSSLSLDDVTLAGSRRDVSDAPQPDSCIAAKQDALFDHLIGERQQRRRNGEVERFRCIEIERQLEFCRLLHRQIVRLCPLEN